MVDARRQLWTLRYRTGPKLASEFRRLVIRATHHHAHVEFQGPVRLGPGFSLEIPDRGTLIIGAGVDFRRGFVCEISGDGRVEIGAGSVFTSHALVQCTTNITVGERCMFGQALVMADGNHRFRDLTKPMLEQGYDFRPIVIEDDVTVTTKCTIIGVHIGTRAVIGANSVVTQDIPAYCVAVGAPGRVVEYFGPPDQRPANLTV